MEYGVVTYTIDKYGRAVGKLQYAVVNTEDNVRVDNLHKTNNLKRYRADKKRYTRINMFISLLFHNIDRLQHYLSHRYATTSSRMSIVRPMIEYIRRTNNNGELVGVEIGAQFGLNSLYILKRLPIKKLYLIEPVVLDNVREKLLKLDNVVLIEKTSSEAASIIPNNLDFCYIDGCHSYDSVKHDIWLYHTKVKSGGIIGGHDYTMGHSGLVRAVIDFLQRHKNTKSFTLSQDWWIVKK